MFVSIFEDAKDKMIQSSNRTTIEQLNSAEVGKMNEYLLQRINNSAPLNQEFLQLSSNNLIKYQ